MRKLVLALTAIALCGALAVPGVAAGTRAPTTVTIETENGDFWGTVSSPRPKRCAKDRKIVLYKQVGSEQDPSIDEKVASDTASWSGGAYEWATGNTGMSGKFYARAKRTEFCKADSSPTVRSVKP
ncbi:MAG TPA: hypothetical protein VF235_03295 [Actinomycetota bacterium]